MPPGPWRLCDCTSRTHACSLLSQRPHRVRPAQPSSRRGLPRSAGASTQAGAPCLALCSVPRTQPAHLPPRSRRWRRGAAAASLRRPPRAHPSAPTLKTPAATQRRRTCTSPCRSPRPSGKDRCVVWEARGMEHARAALPVPPCCSHLRTCQQPCHVECSRRSQRDAREKGTPERMFAREEDLDMRAVSHAERAAAHQHTFPVGPAAGGVWGLGGRLWGRGLRAGSVGCCSCLVG